VTIWGVAGAAYGLILAIAALTQPIRRRHVALAASLAFTFVSVAAGTLTGAFWVNLLLPGALLLGGYWLSGFFFRDPQPWLESWLIGVDHAAAAHRWMDRSPRWLAELLELSYAMDYVVVGGGAIYAATFGTEAVAYYWSLVLASELASFAPMPWLRSRPPRVVGDETKPGLKPGPADDRGSVDHSGPADEPLLSDVAGLAANGIRAEPGLRAAGPPSAKPPSAKPPSAEPPATRRVALRRLNNLILDGASIQANTLPSGHVSGAVAAALGVMAVDAVAGSWLLAAAGLIAIAAVAGRYHYVVDCVTGAVVAFLFWALM
jgi:hypothetical protein